MTLRVGCPTSTFHPTNTIFNPKYQQLTGYSFIWEGADTQLVNFIKVNQVPQLVNVKTTVEYWSKK